MRVELNVEGWKAIQKLLGPTVTDRQCRGWADPEEYDPLPVTRDRFGNVRANAAEVIAWGVRAGVVRVA